MKCHPEPVALRVPQGDPEPVERVEGCYHVPIGRNMLRQAQHGTKDMQSSQGTADLCYLQEFPELRVGLFTKKDRCSSDEACAARLGLGRIAKLNQVHGNVIRVVGKPLSSPLDGDGLITTTPNLALSVRFADCQNFVVYAPRGHVLGVIHAGWRGLAKGVITAFYEKLWEEFKIHPKATFVGAGPSLCKECATFTNPLEELPEHLHPFITGNKVDLQAAAEAEFDALGMPKKHRERHAACTKCDPAWHSFRRDRNPDARNYLIAGMMLQ